MATVRYVDVRMLRACLKFKLLSCGVINIAKWRSHSVLCPSPVCLPKPVAHLDLKCSIIRLARRSMAAVAVHQTLNTQFLSITTFFGLQYMQLHLFLYLRSTSNGLELTPGSVGCISLLVAFWPQYSMCSTMKSAQMTERGITGHLFICGMFFVP